MVPLIMAWDYLIFKGRSVAPEWKPLQDQYLRIQQTATATDNRKLIASMMQMFAVTFAKTFCVKKISKGMFSLRSTAELLAV